MAGAEANVHVGEDVVQLHVEVRGGQIGGAAAYTLFEETKNGTVEISRLGSASPWAYLAVPQPGAYFAEVTDARGKKHRTQTLPVEPAFFDLAAQHGREARASREKHEARRKAEREAAARTAAVATKAAQEAREMQAHRNELLVGGVVAVVVVACLIALYHFVIR